MLWIFFFNRRFCACRRFIFKFFFVIVLLVQRNIPANLFFLGVEYKELFGLLFAQDASTFFVGIFSATLIFIVPPEYSFNWSKQGFFFGGSGSELGPGSSITFFLEEIEVFFSSCNKTNLNVCASLSYTHKMDQAPIEPWKHQNNFHT